MFDERRYNGELAAAREEGMEKGLKKGIEKGMEKGIEKGIEKGVVSVAVQMKKMGLPLETIVQATGLDADVITSL